MAQTEMRQIMAVSHLKFRQEDCIILSVAIPVHQTSTPDCDSEANLTPSHLGCRVFPSCIVNTAEVTPASSPH